MEFKDKRGSNRTQSQIIMWDAWTTAGIHRTLFFVLTDPRQIQTNQWKNREMEKKISLRGSTWRPESRQSCSIRIPQWNIWIRARTTSEGNDDRDRNVDWKRKDRVLCTCLLLLQEWWREKQKCQISEHVEKRVERKEEKWLDQWTQKKDFHKKKVHASQFDLLELDIKTRVSQRPDCGQNMSGWISQVYQVPRHWIWGRRSNGKMAIKELIATNVSSRETAQKRRDEGKTKAGTTIEMSLRIMWGRVDGNMWDRRGRKEKEAESIEWKQALATQRWRGMPKDGNHQRDKKIRWTDGKLITKNGRSNRNLLEKKWWKNGKFYAYHRELGRPSSTGNERKPLKRWKKETIGTNKSMEESLTGRKSSPW